MPSFASAGWPSIRSNENPGGVAASLLTAGMRAILKQFAAALTGTNPPPPLVTNRTTGTVTFFAPSVLNNEFCLKCHGALGQDISPENVAVIQNLYPQDEATGFKLGDLRGAWRIDFPLTSLP